MDAFGHDDTHVSIQTAWDHRRHLQVRTGSVLIYCLDGAALTSTAQAWAAAQVHAADWLPRNQAAPPDRPTAAGAAYPVGSVIFTGRQPVNLSTQGDGLLVTVGCVQIRVRDNTALDTHVRAWAQASDLGTRVFPGRAAPFGHLLHEARISSIQRAAGELQPPKERPARRTGRGRG